MSIPDPMLSALCPSDLGLKAAFWSKKEGEEVQFLRIIGWITVTNYGQSDKDPLAAVVLSLGGRPVFANTSNFPDFVGVFEKDATSGQVIEALKNAEKMRTSMMSPKGSGGGGGGGGAGPRPPTTAPSPLE